VAIYLNFVDVAVASYSGASSGIDICRPGFGKPDCLSNLLARSKGALKAMWSVLETLGLQSSVDLSVVSVAKLRDAKVDLREKLLSGGWDLAEDDMGVLSQLDSDLKMLATKVWESHLTKQAVYFQQILDGKCTDEIWQNILTLAAEVSAMLLEFPQLRADPTEIDLVKFLANAWKMAAMIKSGTCETTSPELNAGRAGLFNIEKLAAKVDDKDDPWACAFWVRFGIEKDMVRKAAKLAKTFDEELTKFSAKVQKCAESIFGKSIVALEEDLSNLPDPLEFPKKFVLVLAKTGKNRPLAAANLVKAQKDLEARIVKAKAAFEAGAAKPYDPKGTTVMERDITAAQALVNTVHQKIRVYAVLAILQNPLIHTESDQGKAYRDDLQQILNSNMTLDPEVKLPAEFVKQGEAVLNGQQVELSKPEGPTDDKEIASSRDSATSAAKKAAPSDRQDAAAAAGPPKGAKRIRLMKTRVGGDAIADAATDPAQAADSLAVGLGKVMESSMGSQMLPWSPVDTTAATLKGDREDGGGRRGDGVEREDSDDGEDDEEEAEEEPDEGEEEEEEEENEEDDDEDIGEDDHEGKQDKVEAEAAKVEPRGSKRMEGDKRGTALPKTKGKAKSEAKAAKAAKAAPTKRKPSASSSASARWARGLLKKEDSRGRGRPRKENAKSARDSENSSKDSAKSPKEPEKRGRKKAKT